MCELYVGSPAQLRVDLDTKDAYVWARFASKALYVGRCCHVEAFWPPSQVHQAVLFGGNCGPVFACPVEALFMRPVKRLAVRLSSLAED